MTTNSLPTGSTGQKLNVQLLMKIFGDKAKFWWNFAVVLQISIIGLSAFTTLTNILTTEAALFIIPTLSIFAPLMRWRSDYMKGEYQSLLRKFEFLDGLGWKIMPRERSEWLIMLSGKQKQQVTEIDKLPDYFSSKKPVSVTRLLENLEESSWWSKHLAKFTATVYGVFTIAVILGSFVILLLSVQGAINQTSSLNIARVVVSTIAALFSIGFIRLTFEYVMFSSSSGRFEERICKILDAGNSIEDEEATKLVQEYQILRSSSPMLPNWAWRFNQEKLNAIWSEERCRD